MPQPDAAEVWESTFARHSSLWGEAPAESARLAAARFAAHGLQTVLIPGVGYGRNAVPFLEAGMEVVGIEISETAIRLAREVHGHTFPIHCGSVTEMPLPDPVFGGTFDGIYCHGLVYLLGPTDRARFLGACRSQLRPGGRLIVSAITKDAPMYGKGQRLGPDWFQTHPGVSLFFYDEASIARELGPLGLVGATQLMERSAGGVPLPFWQIECQAPPP